MSAIVALFADEEAARLGVDSVVRAGVSPDVVHLHRQGQPPRNASGLIADEYAAGGFFSNFASLLDGLLGTKRKADTATSYADVVRHEGVAVSVDSDESDVARAEDLLRAAGALEVSRSGR